MSRSSKQLPRSSVYQLSILLYILGVVLSWLPIGLWLSALYPEQSWLSSELVEGLDGMVEVLLIIPLLVLAANRLGDYFVLLGKYEQSLAMMVLPLMLLGILQYSPISLDWLIVAASLGVIYLLMDGYQIFESPAILLAIGLAMGLLDIIHAKSALMLPIIIVLLYRLRSLSVRNVVALLHGVCLAFLVSVPALYLLRPELSATHWPTWWSAWTHWSPLAPWEMGAWYERLPLFVLIAFWLMSVAVHYLKPRNENIRQREQEVALMQLSLWGIVSSLISGDTSQIFELMVCIPIGLLNVKALSQLSGYVHKASLVLTSILLLTMAALSLSLM